MSLVKRTDNWLPSVFDEMFKTDWLGEPTNTNNIGVNVPAVNIKENNDEFSVEVAAPGKKKDDFEIELDNGLLTISSEMKEEHESRNEDENFTRREFSYSSFKRSFGLPDSVDSAKIAANYEDGVLTISLPKREESKKQAKRLIDIS